MPTANRQPGANFKGNHTGRRMLAWIPAFLKSIAQGLSVNESCRIAGVHPSSVYRHRDMDEDFCACWDRAAQRGTDLLEQEAVRRAYHGVERPVFYKGVECGKVQDYSDTLLMFMLRARRPEMYRDKGNDTTVNVQTNVQANVLAAQAIREMVANGELSGLIEGSTQGERAPTLTGSLGDGGQPPAAEPATPAPADGGTSADMAHAKQPHGGDHPISTR